MTDTKAMGDYDPVVNKSELLETDNVFSLVASITKRIPISILREILNDVDQVINGDIDADNITLTGSIEAVNALFTSLVASGHIEAATFEGNGALINGVIAAGVGGASSTATLSVVCNSDNSTPLAKIVFSKYSTDLADLDENGFVLKTGIPYSHEDDAIPFDKDLDLSGKYLTRSKTINDLVGTWPYYHFDGASYLSVADDDELDFGTDDFSVLIVFKDEVTLNKYALTTGFYFTTIVSNKLRFTHGDGTAVSIDSDDSICADGDIHCAVARCDRDTIVDMHVDGVLQTDNDTPRTGTISNATSLYMGKLNYAGDYTTGDIFKVTLFNRLLTDTEAKEFSANPLKAIEYADEGASQTPVYSSDFSAGIDGFNMSNGTVIGNNDAISDGATSKDNVLKGYADATDAYHRIVKTGILNIGKNNRIKLSIYIPSGQTNVDGYAIGYADAGVLIWFDGFSPTTGSGVGSAGLWTDIIIDQYIPETSNGYLYIYALDDTVFGFIGANDSGDDIIYIVDVETYQTGATAEYKPQDANDDIWRDNQNGNHAVNSGAELVNKSQQLTEEIGTFTAALTCGTSGTITLDTSYDTLSYVKKGSEVRIYGQITVDSVSSPVGALALTIPYTSASDTETEGNTPGTVYFYALGIAASGVIGSNINANSISMLVVDEMNDTGNGSNFADHIAAGTVMRVNITYTTDE